MTEGMRQHRAFVLTCLLERAKRRTVQVSDVKDKIMQVLIEGAAQQEKWAHGHYPYRMATWNIRCAMERKFPGVEWRSADLRKELIELAKEGLVSKCPHESRIGQAVWRLEVKGE